MRRLAKTRIVGTIAAISLSPIAWCGTATSQVTNDQTQRADVIAGEQLDVVTASGDTTSAVAATGAAFSGSATKGSVDVRSRQRVTGTVGAATTVNVANDAGPSLQASAEATAASGAYTIRGTIQGRGLLSGSFLQTTGSNAVQAEATVNAANAQATDATVSSQAVANSQYLGATDGRIAARVTQSVSPTTTVSSEDNVTVGTLKGATTLTSAATANDLTSTGQGASSGRIAVNQTNDSAATLGGVYTTFGASDQTSASAAATGNSANVSNAGGPLAVSTNQNNQSFVFGQAVQYSAGWGSAAADAQATANSVDVSNSGPSLTTDNAQLNGPGGVEASAIFQGGNGYDATVSAEAVGNAITAACMGCGGVMNAANDQNNQADVGAVAQAGVTGTSRTVRGVATAAGNSATYYTSGN